MICIRSQVSINKILTLFVSCKFFPENIVHKNMNICNWNICIKSPAGQICPA